MTPQLPLAHFATRVRAAVDAFFLSRVVASPRGRAFLLDFMADAEDSDERKVFDTLLARVDDPELHELVRIHRDDELRHAALLRACVARQGVTPDPTPDELHILDRIDRDLGGFVDAFLADRQGVMEAYVLLQVVEERAVLQFPLIVRALAGVDPESAAVLARIVRDEERHVKYAIAISRRYAPDPETLAGTLARVRAVEASAFEAHNRALMRHVARHELLAVPRPARLIWRALAA